MLNTKLKHRGLNQMLFAGLMLACVAAHGQQQRSTTRSSTTGRGTSGGSTAGRTLGGGGPTSTRDYPNNTMVGDAVISSDPETRKLIIVTDDETNLQIQEVIKSLDQPKPQVLIKVVFLELTYNNSRDIGIEGSYGKNIGNSWFSGLTTNFGVVGSNVVPTSIVPTKNSSTVSAANAFGLAAAGANPVPPGAGLYQILGQDYQVTLRAIAQAGKAEVLSRPSILARNNQPATISLGQQVPLITNTRFDTTGNQINTVSYQSVGIILKVTPFITSDGLVEMIVSPESSQLEQDRTKWVPISSGSGGSISSPVINSRSADTVVVVPDGQTVIIGGLMERSASQTDSKIPFLGDIPLLGNLFRSKSKSDAKTELMIFLTPHIVQSPLLLSSLSSAEREKANMKPQALTEEDLNRFLDTLPEKKDAPDTKSRGKSKK